MISDIFGFPAQTAGTKIQWVQQEYCAGNRVALGGWCKYPSSPVATLAPPGRPQWILRVFPWLSSIHGAPSRVGFVPLGQCQRFLARHANIHRLSSGRSKTWLWNALVGDYCKTFHDYIMGIKGLCGSRALVRGPFCETRRAHGFSGPGPGSLHGRSGYRPSFADPGATGYHTAGFVLLERSWDPAVS